MDRLLFYLTIDQLSLKLKSQLCLLHLDDATLGEVDVVHELEVIKQDGEELVLMLNGKKSEIISDCAATRNSILLSLLDAHFDSFTNATLPGFPIGEVNSVSDTIREKTHVLKIMRSRL